VAKGNRWRSVNFLWVCCCEMHARGSGVSLCRQETSHVSRSELLSLVNDVL
jgi:hypothetical protein